MQTTLACENIRFSSLFAAGDVSSARNVPSGEERGETDVFAGYNGNQEKNIQRKEPLLHTQHIKDK